MQKISNEFIFSEVYGSINYIGRKQRGLELDSGFSHFARDPVQLTLRKASENVVHFQDNTQVKE